MKKPVLSLSVISIFLFTACSMMDLAGVTATRYQDAPEWYSSIIVDGAITVDMSMEDDVIEIESDANVLPYVKVHERKGALVVEYDEGARFSGRYETVVRIPSGRDIQTVRLSNAAVFRMDTPLSTVFPLSLEAESASRFDFASISATDMVVKLGGASMFLADRVAVSSASIYCHDSSAAVMDGVITACDVILEDASALYPRTDTYVDNYELEINSFYGNLSDASSASFHSDGIVSGTLRNLSVIYYTGMAQNSVTTLDNSEIIQEGY